MHLKINDTVKVDSYEDAESDNPRTDLVGKIGTVTKIDKDETVTVHFEDEDEDVVFYDYELEKL
jgi:hypothetical protein